MNILIIGYGYIGELTYLCIKNMNIAKRILVVAPDVPEKSNDLDTLFFKDINQIDKNDIKNIDCAYILSPAKTHFDVLKQVIALGIRKIFIEKPALVSSQEYDYINNLIKNKNLLIVVGYILRQSLLIEEFKKQAKLLHCEGYKIISCSVNYVKNKKDDARRFTDIGIFEEVYHIWDLLFNGVLFDRPLKIIPICQKFKEDEEQANRFVKGHFEYRLNYSFEEFINVYIESSFESSIKERKFNFLFQNEDSKRTISLKFDDDAINDIIQVFDDKLITLKESSYKAKEKLKRQIDKTLKYFQFGPESSNLHIYSDSVYLNNIIKSITQG